MIDWIEMGRKTIDLLRCTFWQDLMDRLGLNYKGVSDGGDIE